MVLMFSFQSTTSLPTSPNLHTYSLNNHKSLHNLLFLNTPIPLIG